VGLGRRPHRLEPVPGAAPAPGPPPTQGR
jgi:hypothetical protein